MIPVGQTYRPAVGLDVRSILVMVILGTAVAILAAVPVWLWEVSPVPTLALVASIVQGVLIGFALALVARRLKVRNPRLVKVIGVGCGLLSVALVHYGHYLRMVSQAQGPLRAKIEGAKVPAAEKRALLDRLDADPASFLDPILVQKIGHRGFLGSLILRNQEGVTLKGRPVSGWYLGLLWGFEALLVAVAAAEIASVRASRLFCDDCREWCAREPNAVVLPGTATIPLVEGIVADDPGRIAALRDHPADDEELDKVVVSLHYCPHCDQTFADVSHFVHDGKVTKVSVPLKQVRISPEMAAACWAHHDPQADPEPMVEGGAGPRADAESS